MRAPWENAFPLDPARVHAILREVVPELRIAEVRALGEGWDFVTYLADETWVFRFAKQSHSGRALARELTMLGRLRGELASRATGADGRIEIPAYRFHFASAPGHPGAFAGYPLLAGRGLGEFAPGEVDLPRIGRQLGAWLAEVHASEPIRRPARPPHHFAADLVEFRESFRQLQPHLPHAIGRELGPLLAGEHPALSGPASFCHGDLGSEHVLVDDDAAHIAAVIDWTDARWDDPTIDFAGIWAWGGDAAAAAVCSGYGRELHAAEWRSLRLRGACIGLGTAHYGWFGGRPDEFRAGLAMLERMHQAGQLVDCSRPDP
jgi:aminoglycoside phosphotransferase (APT) family kinase protein